MKGPQSTAITTVERRLDVYTQDPSWQRLWICLEPQNWRSLVLVPAGRDSSIDVVNGLAGVAWQQRGGRVIVADLRTISLPALGNARMALRKRIEDGDRILIAISALDVNPTSTAIAREADRAVVCVFAGRAERAQVRSIVRELGPQRCLGSILVTP